MDEIDVVHFNVGGTSFHTTVSTLLSVQDTYFSAQLSGRYAAGSVVFLDRDASRFRHILNYLRNGTLHIGDNLELHQEILEEADYFQITPLVEALQQDIDHIINDREQKRQQGSEDGSTLNEIASKLKKLEQRSPLHVAPPRSCLIPRLALSLIDPTYITQAST